MLITTDHALVRMHFWPNKRRQTKGLLLFYVRKKSCTILFSISRLYNSTSHAPLIHIYLPASYEVYRGLMSWKRLLFFCFSYFLFFFIPIFMTLTHISRNKKKTNIFILWLTDRAFVVNKNQHFNCASNRRLHYCTRTHTNRPKLTDVLHTFSSTNSKANNTIFPNHNPINVV